MRSMRVPLTLLMLAIPMVPSSAQDPVHVNPRSVSVAFEDARVRVLRTLYAPHEKVALHAHPAIAGVSITASHLRITPSGGTPLEISRSAGEVYWSEPTAHSVESLSDEPTETIEIEFKSASQSAIESVQHEPAPKIPPGGPLAVEEEPHHHLVYQNQYVRMLEVRLAPGETTEFHTHSHDNLAVRLSEAVVTRQDQGKDWVPPSKVVPGEVSLTKGAESPYTHRVKNVGNTPFRVIDVELLQPAH